VSRNRRSRPDAVVDFPTSRLILSDAAQPLAATTACRWLPGSPLSTPDPTRGARLPQRGQPRSREPSQPSGMKPSTSNGNKAAMPRCKHQRLNLPAAPAPFRARHAMSLFPHSRCEKD